MLGQLRAINSRLGEIEVRIDRVGDRVNRLIGERRRADLNRAIDKACNIGSRQMALFRTYTRALESGLDLGKLLEGRASASTAEREALENRVVENIDEFISDYQRGYGHYTEQIDQLRRMLVPRLGDLGTTPVLTTFGKVLLSRDRFIHRADSEAVRGLYAALSEIRALATLMLAEYWDGRERQTDEERVLHEFLTDTRAAESGLPKMIPPGVVIDLGSDRDSANRMPMWFAPTKKDLGWIPRQDAGLQDSIAVEEVDDALRKLNARKPWGKGWSAPTKEEFEALISTGCRVDPDHPARALRGCGNAVPAGSNIAAYLQRLNKGDENWQQLFCQRLTNPNCPRVLGRPGGGINPTCSSGPPTATRSDAGFLTLAPDARFHEVFPHLPQNAPRRRSATGPENLPYIREACHSYFRSLVLGPPRQRNHLTEGVLLATRHTGPQDANPKSHWDFMAQPVPGLNR